MCHMISRCVTSVRRGVTRRACVVWGSVAAPTRSRPSTSFEPVGEPGLRRRQAEGAQAAKVVCRRQFRTQVCVLEGHPLPLPSAPALSPSHLHDRQCPLPSLSPPRPPWFGVLLPLPLAFPRDAWALTFLMAIRFKSVCVVGLGLDAQHV